MRNHISYTVLGVALVAGASAAQAETVITREVVAPPVEAVVTQPDAMVVAQDAVVTVPGTVATTPVSETVETVRTVRSSTVAPRARTARRHVVRDHTARVTTTRTILRERIVPAPVVEPIAEPAYGDVVEAPMAPAYPRPLYDVAAPAVAPAPAFGAGVAVPTYRYVYQPDRILVIDPYTNVTVQAIPR